MNLHGFRHSHATMMLEITNDVYNVSKRLGHENIEITDTYLHVNNKIQREMAQKIEDVIKSEEKNKIERDEAAYRLVSLLYFILVINNIFIINIFKTKDLESIN